MLIPTTLHLFWDDHPLSFLNLCTILSFKKHNPTWTIKVWHPTESKKNNTWNTQQNRDVYTGKNYWNYLDKIEGVSIHPIQMSSIGFLNDASVVHQSDFFRYWVLYTEGGYWSDFDVIYIKPLAEMIDLSYSCVIVRCETVFPIGFMGARKGSPLFKVLCENALQHYDPSEYFSIGRKLWKKVFPYASTLNNLESIEKVLQNRFKGEKIKVFGRSSYLHFRVRIIEKMTIPDQGFTIKKMKLPKETFGIHWFNANPIAKNFQTNLNVNIDNKLYNENMDIDTLSFLEQHIFEYILDEIKK